MDLNGYKLVFEDDFNGTELDMNLWEYRGTGKRSCRYMAPEAVRVENGNMIMKYDYHNGEFGEGWYSGMIKLKQQFCKGYFECRCICNDHITRDGSGFWSAFWIQAGAPYTPSISKGGPGGAELDIIEGFLNYYTLRPAVEHNVHCAGYPDGSGEGMRSMGAKSIEVPTCYTEYHTYGLEWTDEVYRFYVDGECTLETAWAEGTSQVAEDVIFSLELPGVEPEDKDRSGEFIVDYVRIYQKED